MTRTSMRAVLGAAVLALLLAAAPAHAVTTERFPVPEGARDFGDGSHGWSGVTVYGGLCLIPGVTCPSAMSSWQASGGTGGPGDGYVRSSVTTVAGVASDVTTHLTSPQFTYGGLSPSQVRFSVRRRAEMGAIINLGGTATYRVVLDDLGTPSGEDVVVVSERPVNQPGDWGEPEVHALANSAIVPGHTYRLRISTHVDTPAAVVVSGTADYDDVELAVSYLTPPTDLTTPEVLIDEQGIRVAGSVDPNGLPTAVVADYGTTTAYGQTAGPVTVDGDGPTGYVIPLSGLTAGQTYHLRVTATNADSDPQAPLRSADITFTVPALPSDAAPLVFGPVNSRERLVVFERAPDVHTAVIEVSSPGGALLGTFPVPSGEDRRTIELPAADGTYVVRVRRTNPGGTTLSNGWTVVLDTTGPATGEVNATLSPALSNQPQRTLTFNRPADAATVTGQLLDGEGTEVGEPVTIAGEQADFLLPAPGTYQVRLALTDAAGNTSSATSNTTVYDTSAPDPGGGPTVTGPQEQRERLVSFVRDPSTTSATITIRNDAGALVGSVDVPSGSSAGIVLPDLDGTYHVAVVQTDAAGNSATSPSTTVILDRTPFFDDEEQNGSGGATTNGGTTTTPQTPGASPTTTTGAPQTTAQTTAQSTTTAATLGLPAFGNQRSAGALAARCAGDDLVLTSVRRSSRRIQVAGVSVFAAGTRVLITNARTKRTLVTVTIRGNGRFGGSFARPRSLSGLTLLAVAGTATSRNHKATRANEISGIKASSGGLTIRGRVSFRSLGKALRFEVRGGRGLTACRANRKLKVVGKPRVDRSGRYTVHIATPTGTGPLIIRTRVLGRSVSYSLFALR